MKICPFICCLELYANDIVLEQQNFDFR